MMFGLNSIRRRRGSVLITTLFVVVLIVTLMGAVMPLTLSGYGLARTDRDRAGALAAAEAGLNWQIGRINNHLWEKNDSGTTVTTLDNWPTSTGSAPSTASTVVLLTDSSGNWTQRFIVGTSTDPYTVGSTGTFMITSEGQVQAADGHVVKRRVQCGGGGLASLFDSAAIFAFSTSTSSSSPAWSMGGSSSIVGGCGSNGLISGSGSPSITVGPLGLWGSSASVSGVTTTGITTTTRSAIFTTDTADTAANLFMNGVTTGSGVAGWAPTYDSGGNVTGPSDSYSRKVNSQAQIVSSSDTWIRDVAASEFTNSQGFLVLDHHITNFNGTNKLRLRPGVYYFHEINLTNSDSVEIANDWYRSDGVTALYDNNHNLVGSAGTVSDFDSVGNRITIFVDAATGSHSSSYVASSIGSGVSENLQGDKSSSNSIRYRRPGNFRIYAKNTGNFTVTGSSSSPVEFNCNLLHYNTDSSGSYYGSVSLNTGAYLYGGLFAWTVSLGGSATVQQYGSGVFSSNDPVTVSPSSGSGGGLSGGFGGWQWVEIAAS
jgi:Tfp pilus assembly protein PilX